jgi:hypothetical protein
MLANEGLTFLEGEVVNEEKQKGVDGKACWKGYKRMGTKQKGGKTVDNCVKMEDHGPEKSRWYDCKAQAEYDREGTTWPKKDLLRTMLNIINAEGDMAKDQLRIDMLYVSIINADENLPEWVQKKITQSCGLHRYC